MALSDTQKACAQHLAADLEGMVLERDGHRLGFRLAEEGERALTGRQRRLIARHLVQHHCESNVLHVLDSPEVRAW